jgi:hypothetical protein
MGATLQSRWRGAMKRALFAVGILLLVLFAMRAWSTQRPNAPVGGYHYSIIKCSDDILVAHDCYSNGEAIGISCLKEVSGLRTKTTCYVLVKES